LTVGDARVQPEHSASASKNNSEASMRYIPLVLAGLAWAAAASPTPAAAYFYDPITREYVPYHQDPSYQPRRGSRSQGSYRPLLGGSAFRQIVSYTGGQAPGTVVISTAERRLYYVLGSGQAIRYGIGVGRAGFQWAGTRTITMKREWPDWRPPRQMLRRRPDLPRYMSGGINNPLGARAMYLGSSLYRIHGSNEPETIGQAVSSGCFRMTNADVADLYSRVRVGTRVVVR
jgi:lipoprotein-anchoring transpeptidase ErfK/SrfK